MSAPQVGKVKSLNIDAYDGTTDPDDQLAAYKHLMYLQGVYDATWCKYFPTTLKGVAQKWFNSLPDQSIRNFTELSMIFTHHFMANKQLQKTSIDLGKIRQGEQETLRSYVHRFNNESLQITGLTEEVAFHNFFKGLLDRSRFKFDIVHKGVRSMAEVMYEAKSYIRATKLYSMSQNKKGKEKDRPREDDKPTTAKVKLCGQRPPHKIRPARREDEESLNSTRICTQFSWK